jgi:pyroglutamyl-peptidase
MAKKLLLTAFRPYENYARNVSAEVQKALSAGITRDAAEGNERLAMAGSRREFFAALYDVDFDKIEASLNADLTPDVGAIVLMGQAPGRSTIDLERFAINAGVRPGSAGDSFPLETGGPDGLQSDLPLADWARRLKEQGLPVRQSFHAGTYLCNASLYYALRSFQQRGLPRGAVFLHLPLAKESFPDAAVSLPMETIVKAAEATIQLAIDWVEEQERASSLA